MEWEWSKFDDRGLARYVIKDAANLVRLPLNRHDLALDVDGRRQVVEAIYHALVKANKKVRYAPEKYNPSAHQLRSWMLQEKERVWIWHYFSAGCVWATSCYPC